MAKGRGDDLRPFLSASHTVPPAEAFPTLKKAAISKAGQPVYVPPWKWLFRHAGILLGIHLCRGGYFSGTKKAGKLHAVTYRLYYLSGGEG